MNDPWKKLRVTYRAITGREPEIVQLRGIMPDTRLTPRLAEQAALVACGGRSGVTVWDNEHGYGYRLYANSARKLKNETL